MKTPAHRCCYKWPLNESLIKRPYKEKTITTDSKALQFNELTRCNR